MLHSHWPCVIEGLPEFSGPKHVHKAHQQKFCVREDRPIRRVYILPNLITTFGLACGLFVIFKMSMLEPGAASYPAIRASALLLLLAAGADMLDGAIARLMRAESEFGVVFDSLSDAITFGAAPAVMMLKSLSIPSENPLALLASTSAMLYAVCGVLRLARYSSGKGKTQDEENSSMRLFKGLPITASACAAVSATLFMISPEFERIIPFSSNSRATASICVMILLGYFMVSRWSFPGIKALQIKTQSINLIFFAVLMTIVLFYGILHYFSIVFVAIAWGYLACAWIYAVVVGVRARRASRMTEFDRP